MQTAARPVIATRVNPIAGRRIRGRIPRLSLILSSYDLLTIPPAGPSPHFQHAKSHDSTTSPEAIVVQNWEEEALAQAPAPPGHSSRPRYRARAQVPRGRA